jgi:dipeptidyl aminopeptidase/acylaminoacyl peptidase
MKSRRLLLVPALCLATIAAAQPPPVEAFAALPTTQSPSISPDGQRIAFIAQAPQGTLVYAAQLATNTADAIVAVTGELDARAVTWANNDTLILLVSQSDTLNFAARLAEVLAPFGIDLAARELTVRQFAGARAIGGGLFVRGRRLIGYERSTGRVLMQFGGALYTMNAKNGDADERDDGSSFTRDWVVDDKGLPRYRTQYRDKTDYFQILRRLDNGLWETFVERTIDLPEIDLHGLDAQGELIVGGRPLDVGRYGLYTVTADGRRGRTVYADDTLDLADVRVDPYTNLVLGAAVESRSPEWFDEELAKQQAGLDDTFPGEDPWIVDWSLDRSRFIVRTEQNNRAPAFYLYDAKAGTANQIARTYPALDRVELAPRLPYTYKARDGVEIPGYLTRPLGVEGPAPLVLLPHRGPMERDVDGFDWFAHFLASRGYVVLQPNYRGSSGYGRAWEEAGYGGWGLGVMQHDLSDGIAALVAAGIVDPERVCIVGASYGGYAALAGATFTPELYRCAAAVNGVSDLRDMHTLYIGRRDGRSAAMTLWERSMGVEEPRSQREKLIAASPARHAERVQAAVLLIHARDDAVVPFGQSRSMERALRDAGKTVQLVELEGEDHWLSDAPTRLETLKALDTFLAEQLGSR